MEFHIGRRIAFLRRNKKENQEKIANIVGISRSHYSSLELGKRSWQKEFEEPLSKYFSVTSNYFKVQEKSDFVKRKINNLFILLLKDDLLNAKKIIESFEDPIINMEQEFEFNLLAGTFYIRINDFTKLSNLIDAYFFVFSPDDIANQLSQNVQNYFHLYRANFSAWKKNSFNQLYNWEILVKKLEGSALEKYAKLHLITALSENEKYGSALLEASNLLPKVFEEASLFSMQVLIRISGININLSQYQDSLDTLNKIEALLEKNYIAEYKGIMLQHQGYILFVMNNYEEAISTYNSSLELLEDKSRIITVLFSMIDCCVAIKDWKNMKKYLNQLKNYPVSFHQIMVINALEGEVFLHEGNFKNGKKLIKMALNYFKENNLKSNQYHLLGQLGNYYHETGDFKNSANYYNQKEMLK